MTSISFFTPVVYHKQDKTIPEKALELVDEYFYLGNKYRVQVFTSESENPGFSIINHPIDRQRSWVNTALKVASYCTLIIPCIGFFLKGALRSHLQISSIERQPFNDSNGLIEKLPKDILKLVNSFLSYKDQTYLAPTCICAAKRGRDCEARIAPLNRKILRLDSLSKEDVQNLLIDLITFRYTGHPKFWIPAMDNLMSYMRQDSSIDSCIQMHTKIARSLASSSKSISLSQLDIFLRYLKLERFCAWVVYRILEQYMLHPNFQSQVAELLKRYLIQSAERLVQIKEKPHQQRLYGEIVIDPRDWFGFNSEQTSLWVLPGAEAGETARIPPLLLKVLWDRIQSLHDSRGDVPLMVKMSSKAEAAMPRNFVLELARLVTNEKMFAYHNHGIDPTKLENPKYARNIEELSKAEWDELQRVIPGSV